MSYRENDLDQLLRRTADLEAQLDEARAERRRLEQALGEQHEGRLDLRAGCATCGGALERRTPGWLESRSRTG